MLFKPELCQAILDKLKTQARWLAKEGEFAVNQHGRIIPDPYRGDKIDAVYSANGSLKWQVGRTYPVKPGRGKKAVGRFKLLAIRKEWLQDISEADMQAEGVNPDDFTYAPSASLCQEWMGFWDNINTKQGATWSDNPEVWVLTFEVVKGEK